MSREEVVVICIGNADRGDDGAALAVRDELAARRLRGVDVVAAIGEPAALVEHWDRRRLAIVVDAVMSGAPPGTVHRIECGPEGWSAAPVRASSSHALGIGAAVALGTALDRLPGRLIVLGIEAGASSWGGLLSAPVAAAVVRMTDAVAAEAAGEAGRSG